MGGYHCEVMFTVLQVTQPHQHASGEPQVFKRGGNLLPGRDRDSGRENVTEKYRFKVKLRGGGGGRECYILSKPKTHNLHVMCDVCECCVCVGGECLLCVWELVYSM